MCAREIGGGVGGGWLWRVIGIVEVELLFCCFR